MLIAENAFKKSFTVAGTHVGDLIDRQYVEAVRIELGYRMYQHELLPNGKREAVYRRTLAAHAFYFDAFSVVNRPPERSSWLHAQGQMVRVAS